MITGKIKSDIDKLWDAFWTGGISNPLNVIEQITYLLFIKRLDDLQVKKEYLANKINKPIKNTIFTQKQNHLRWSLFKDLDPQSMFELVKNEVFDFIKTLSDLNNESVTDKSAVNSETAYAEHMKDAIFMIPKASLLVQVVEMISKLPLEDRDTNGDVYEYLLMKINTAGVNGQFRTPRHIIKLMTEMIAPTPEDTVCDPACGTGGFLMATGEYLREHHSKLFADHTQRAHFHNELFNGFDFDATMLRIGSMNMMLHGIDNPNIHSKDTLSKNFTSEEKYSIVMANPPFKGSLDNNDVSDTLLTDVNTKKTELLFIALMLRILKLGGRCAVIVPDGVLFGSSKAHVGIRKKLVEDNTLQAVISMPSGVFKPYAGVSTAILLFTKTGTGGTDKVWFYAMLADGLSLDDKRTELDKDKHASNNLPDILKRWQNLDKENERKRTEQSFLVPKAEIAENNYDLSINRYKEVVYEEVEYEEPKVIIAQVKELQKSIAEGLEKLEGMIG